MDLGRHTTNTRVWVLTHTQRQTCTHAHVHANAIYSSETGNLWQTKLQILPKSSLVNQWVFIGVTCRGRNDSDSYITKPTPAWVTTPKGCVHCTACGQLSRLENVLSRYLCWSNPLPGSWPGLWVFAAQLPFFQEDSQLLCLLRQGGPRFWSVSGTSYGYFDLFTFLLELPRTDGMFQSFSMSKEP